MQRRLLFVLALVVVVGASGWYFAQRLWSSPDPQSESTQLANEAASCLFDADFCAYLLAQAAAMQKGMVMEVQTEMVDYGTSTSEIYLDGAGNMSTASYDEAGNLLGQTMIVAGTTYVQDLTDQAWYAINPDTSSSSAPPAFDQARLFPEVSLGTSPELLDVADTVQFIGREACGELECFKYQIAERDTTAEDPATTYVWIDVREHLARQMETVHSQGRTTMTYRYEEVVLSQPTPLKSMPALVFPVGNDVEVDAMNADQAGQGSQPSEAEWEQMMQEYALDR